MENQTVFHYRYSASEQKEVERIRKKYIPQERDKLSLLKELDTRVQTAGMIQGLTVGVIGCLIFGVGMCFGLGVFTGAAPIAALLCGLGTAIMLPAYPIYCLIAKRTKEKLVPEILRLSDELMNS